MKHTTRELYDIDPKMLATLPYKEALELKLSQASSRLYKKVRQNEQIGVSADKLQDAIDFNRSLLEELR